MLLVCGVTGQLGGRIARKLAERERGLRAFARGGAGTSGLEALGAEMAVATSATT